MVGLKKTISKLLIGRIKEIPILRLLFGQNRKLSILRVLIGLEQSSRPIRGQDYKLGQSEWKRWVRIWIIQSPLEITKTVFRIILNSFFTFRANSKIHNHGRAWNWSGIFMIGYTIYSRYYKYCNMILMQRLEGHITMKKKHEKWFLGFLFKNTLKWIIFYFLKSHFLLDQSDSTKILDFDWLNTFLWPIYLSDSFLD